MYFAEKIAILTLLIVVKDMILSKTVGEASQMSIKRDTQLVLVLLEESRYIYLEEDLSNFFNLNLIVRCENDNIMIKEIE